ncbi:hypothetical protein [Streptomyces sp. NPDC048002]|uniref:hypothetical protein n=1 Tax=unclassified Streptomyces TaxID=2593676 RepID=UPI0033F01506
MTGKGWAATYTWRTVASVILCTLTLANLAGQLIVTAPNIATPVAAGCTAGVAFLGLRADPVNRSSYIMVLRIVAICFAFSLFLSLILLGSSVSGYGSVVGE